MTKKQKIIISFSIYLVLALGNSFLLSGNNFIYSVLNFILLCFLLFVALKDTVITYFKTRSLTIKKTIHENEQDYNTALNNKSEASKKLELLNLSKEAHLKNSKELAIKEKDFLLNEANGLAKKIVEDAKNLANQEKQKSFLSLKSQTTKRAIKLARDEFKQNLTAIEHEKLGAEFINKLKQERL